MSIALVVPSQYLICDIFLKKKRFVYPRYDLTVSNQNEGDVKTNCSDWFSHFCICDANLKIEYFETPPYVFTVNGTVDGILPGNGIACVSKNLKLGLKYLKYKSEVGTIRYD